MKKVLLLAAVACMAMTASAQVKADKAQAQLCKAPYAVNTAKKAAHKADVVLQDSQFIVGLFDTDEYDEDGIGFKTPVTMEVATSISSAYYEGMKDVTVDGIRFALAEGATIKSVKLYVVDNEGGIILEPVASKSVDTRCAAGWNYIEFDDPYTVDMEYAELMPAYEVVLTGSNYPIGMYTGPADYYSFLAYGDLEDKGAAWYSFGENYGTVAMQMVCSAAQPEGIDLQTTSYNTSAVAINQRFMPTVNVISNSGTAISSVDYTLTMDGNEFTGTATLNLAAGYRQKGSFTPELTAPDKAGSYPVEITLSKVNGEDITPVTLKGTQDVVTRLAPRMNVIEEFTGTGCGYCPMGWVGMEYVKEHMSDQAYVIALHHYNNTDPMYVATYHDPVFSGAPQCAINRMTTDIPPYAEYMQAYLPQFTAIVPEVDIPEIKAVFTNDELTTVHATATTEFLTDVPGSELVFVLTADELSGTTSAWKQSNYLYNATTAQYVPSAADFCRGGKWAQSSVALVFNDVMIGSSWPSSTKPNVVPKFSNPAAGETETSEATLDLPTKSALKNALKKDKIYLTAFVLCADGHIANAKRCKVEVAEGIGTVLAPSSTDDAPAYDLSGRTVHQSAKGITIQGGKKVIR